MSPGQDWPVPLHAAQDALATPRARTATARPRISVVVPTFRRETMLLRCLESVLGQTFEAFELLVTNDDPQGDWPASVSALAEADPRVRLLSSERRLGQAGNLNRAMRAAQGEWIKPVFDDDVLEPRALEVLLAAAEASPGVVLVRGLASHHVDGRLRRVDRAMRGVRGPLPGREALAGMYRQDFEIGTPTQVLVRSDVVRSGAWMPEEPSLRIGVDWWWYATLLQRGDLLLLDRLVAQEHQGHDTVTKRMGEDVLYVELDVLRRRLYEVLTRGASAVAGEESARDGGGPLADDKDQGASGALTGECLKLPPLADVQGMNRLLRAACAWRAGRRMEALRRAAGVRNAGAWRLFARVAWRRVRSRRSCA